MKQTIFCSLTMMFVVLSNNFSYAQAITDKRVWVANIVNSDVNQRTKRIKIRILTDPLLPSGRPGEKPTFPTWMGAPFVKLTYCPYSITTSGQLKDNEVATDKYTFYDKNLKCEDLGKGKYYSVYHLFRLEKVAMATNTQLGLSWTFKSNFAASGGWANRTLFVINNTADLLMYKNVLQDVLAKFTQDDSVCKNCMVLK